VVGVGGGPVLFLPELDVESGEEGVADFFFGVVGAVWEGGPVVVWAEELACEAALWLDGVADEGP
jgi:hypothetical protein